MSAYVVSGRIGRVTPRLASADVRLDASPRGALANAEAEAASVVVTDPDDLLPGPPPTFGERLDAARERWAQLTFYLFDPESWR